MISDSGGAQKHSLTFTAASRRSELVRTVAQAHRRREDWEGTRRRVFAEDLLRAKNPASSVRMELAPFIFAFAAETSREKIGSHDPVFRPSDRENFPVPEISARSEVSELKVTIRARKVRRTVGDLASRLRRSGIPARAFELLACAESRVSHPTSPADETRVCPEVLNPERLLSSFVLLNTGGRVQPYNAGWPSSGA
jgi:hypothetical protein